MAIMHYDDSLNKHHHSGRNTAGQMLAHSDRQNFNISISVSAGWRDSYKKYFEAYIMTPQNPTLVVIDSLSTNVTRKAINPDMDSRKIFELAVELASDHYEAFLRKVLEENGFRPSD